MTTRPNRGRPIRGQHRTSTKRKSVTLYADELAMLDLAAAVSEHRGVNPSGTAAEIARRAVRGLRADLDAWANDHNLPEALRDEARRLLS